jgi:hypothetical protein
MVRITDIRSDGANAGSDRAAAAAPATGEHAETAATKPRARRAASPANETAPDGAPE